jgi:cyclase
MIATRVIPTLLLRGTGLVKTTHFKDPKYVGDPINAIRIFNDKEVDELILLDITRATEGAGPAFEVIRDTASECFMPLAYGGGISSLSDIERILSIGVEKVVMNTAALKNPSLVESAARNFGSQAIVVSIDVRRKLFGGYEVVGKRATERTGIDPVAFASHCESLGAGEIMVTSVERDGTMQGYDHELITKVSSAVTAPVIASGGARDLTDMAEASKNSGASAVAAGALFVFQGKHRAVLISYPSPQVLREAFG